jgi:hypothetical protein
VWWRRAHRAVGRRSPGFRARGWSGLLAAALSVRTAPALGYDKQACVRASDDAQTLRIDGKLRAAREQFLVCADASCPTIVRSACTQWLTEVEASLPTIVPAARDPNGNDLPNVRLFLDGQPLADHLDGRPLAVDPGTHVLRFVAADATVVEQSVVIREGEKGRPITVGFARRALPEPRAVESRSVASSKALGPAASATTVGSGGGAAPPAAGGPPTAAYLLAGASALAFASLAYFGVKFVVDLNHLKGTCGSSCPSDQTNPVHTEELVADVSLGVGVVAGALAAWLLLSSRPEPRTSLGVGVRFQPVAGGVVAGIVRDF